MGSWTLSHLHCYTRVAQHQESCYKVTILTVPAASHKPQNGKQHRKVGESTLVSNKSMKFHLALGQMSEELAHYWSVTLSLLNNIA